MARSPTKTSSQIDLSGPFFTSDPAKTFRQNIRRLTDAIAAEAEADVRQQMRAGEGSRSPMRGITPARVSGHVIGRTKSLTGRRWAVTAVVSVTPGWGSTKAQGTTLMAAAATVERRVHAFRRTTSRMRRAKAINAAELLKGIR